MDCVTDAGEAAIVYCADLRWRGLHAMIGGLLESRNGAEPRTRTALGRHRISQTANEIAVEHRRLKVSGLWQSLSPPVQRTVYEERGGSIVWNCIQPGSRASLRIGERELAGLGYAECLTVTLPSWQLPIRCLRWGRFVSADHAFAWVDWQGPFSTRFAFLNGRESTLLSASESEVVTREAALKIEGGDSLRAGRLSSTILSGAPALKRLFPASLFNIREQKWKSRGTLAQSGRTNEGWVIHEVVEWEP
jgi:hypothetical protein